MKMYVLLRSDLHPKYASVQGGHALAQFAIQNGSAFKQWNNGTLVYLNGGTLRSLREKVERIRNKTNYYWSVFYETDIDNQITAIAVYCDGKIFKDLELF